MFGGNCTFNDAKCLQWQVFMAILFWCPNCRKSTNVKHVHYCTDFKCCTLGAVTNSKIYFIIIRRAWE